MGGRSLCPPGGAYEYVYDVGGYIQTLTKEAENSGKADLASQSWKNKVSFGGFLPKFTQRLISREICEKIQNR